MKKSLYERMREEKNIKSDIQELLRNAFYFKANNVAQYYFELSDQSEWDVRKDFYPIAPPFKNFFIEFNMPHFFLEPDGLKKLSKNLYQRIGLLFDTDDFKQDTDPAIKAFVEEGLRWSYRVYLYMEKRQEIQEILCWCFCISEDGVFWFDKNKSDADFRNLATIIIDPSFKGNEEIADTGFRNFLHVGLLTISFIHCKNVKVIKKGGNLSHQTIPKRRRHVPKLEYHILDIEPLRKIIRYIAEARKTGLKQSLHIVRGHFKKYGGENGLLFGKHSGFFWWADHCQGSISEGVIGKDYRINLDDGKPGDSHEVL